MQHQRFSPKRRLRAFSLVLALIAADVFGAEIPPAEALQAGFNLKYQDYLTPASQMLLPFPRVEISAWKALQAARRFSVIYSEADKFYNNKVYQFTLYRAEDDGSYYLDAKGGFWGMDELVYGPLSEPQLR